MPQSYSTDLHVRWLVVYMHLAHICRLTPSRISNMSEHTTRQLLRLLLPIRRCATPTTKEYNVPKILLGDFDLLHLILETPGVYLHELRAELFKMFGVHVSAATICRMLKFMSCARQAIRQVALQQSDVIRAQFMATQCPCTCMIPGC